MLIKARSALVKKTLRKWYPKSSYSCFLQTPILDLLFLRGASQFLGLPGQTAPLCCKTEEWTGVVCFRVKVRGADRNHERWQKGNEKHIRIKSILYRTAQMPNPEWLPRHSLLEVQCFLEPLRPQSLSYPAPWSSNSNSSQHTMAPQAHISNVRPFLKGQQEALPHPSMHPSFPYRVFSKEGKLQKRRSSYIKGHPSTALLPTPFSCC